MQERESISINRSDTSLSRSKQLDFAVPASRIVSLSSGEFVAMVADDPFEKIRLKMFHAGIVNDPEKLHKEATAFKQIPIVSRVTAQQFLDNFHQVKLDIKSLLLKQVTALKGEK